MRDEFDMFDLPDFYEPRTSSRWVDPKRTRTKQEYPYSYSEFFHFGKRADISAKGVQAVYSDRLWQWDYDKCHKAHKTHLNCRFEQASPAQLSAFLSEYNGKPCTVVALAEGCNPSTGYPYYILWYTIQS